MPPPFLFALLLTQAPPAVVRPAAETVPPARIELTTPFPVRLGSVGPREVKAAVFGIRSTHDQPFRFRLLDLSLGSSLDPAQLAAPLAPGEVRLVTVRVDPSGLAGPVKGAVRLGTDDPAQPSYILRWELEVRPEVAVDSLRKSLGEVAPHERPDVRFRFTREGGEPLKLVLVGTLPSHLEGGLVHEGAAADLRLALRPERLEPGVTAGLEVLKVATNGPQQPLFTLYLDWRIAAAVIPSPSRLVYTDPKTTLLALELKSRDGQSFRITSVRVLGGGYEVIDAPGPPAAEQVLRIRRTGTQAGAVLEVACSNMDGPLKVPLKYLDPGVRPAASPATEPPPIAPHAH